MEPNPNPEQQPNTYEQFGIEPTDPNAVQIEPPQKDVQEYALPEAPSIDDIIGPNEDEDFDVTTSTTMPNRNVSTTSTTSQNIPTTTSTTNPNLATSTTPPNIPTTTRKPETTIPGPVSTTTSAERPSTLPNLTTSTTPPNIPTTLPESTIPRPGPESQPEA